MTTFTIDTDNNITALASIDGATGEVFTSEEALAALAATWPGSRLIEIWNGLTGVTPVKKFKDRATGVSRIWNAIQTLEGVAQEDARTTPDTPQDTPAIVPEEDPTADIATLEPAAQKLAREGSKTAQVITMLKRDAGTTLEEIMTAMGWQKHTTRAMLSAGGSLAKKHGLVVISEKVGDKRTYFIKA